MEQISDFNGGDEFGSKLLPKLNEFLELAKSLGFPIVIAVEVGNNQDRSCVSVSLGCGSKSSAAARKEESQSEHADGRARGSLEAASGVDLSVVRDQESLQAELENAIREQARLIAASDAAVTANKRRQAAIDRLEDAEAEYTGPTADEARKLEELACDDIARAESQLRDAEEALRVAVLESINYASLRKAAEQHESIVAQCRQAIEADSPLPIDQAD